MSGQLISAVGVVVPARDEEEHIDACLTGIRRALLRLPPGVASAVTVVLDRCRDSTPQRVAELTGDWPDAVALRVGAAGGRRAGASGRSGRRSEPVHLVAGSGVGALRDVGVRDVLTRLAPHHPAATWLLHTDADTEVPADWALAHLRLAAGGAAGVAGMADLAGPLELPAPARRRYRAIVRDGVEGARHRHVYGANLGVRADAYLAVGGFPSDGDGEDHALWERLTDQGYPLVQPTGLRVRTSARLHGRADGGLAGLLRELQHPEQARDDSAPAG